MFKYILLVVVILVVMGLARTDEIADDIATAQETVEIKQAMQDRQAQDEMDIVRLSIYKKWGR